LNFFVKRNRGGKATANISITINKYLSQIDP
jgi:hypothetical protein